MVFVTICFRVCSRHGIVSGSIPSETDRSAEMTGRTLKGNLAFLSAGILSILSLVAAVGGVSMIVIVFVMDHSPSRVGWLFIIVGGFTVASGLLGVFSSDRRDCFTWQMVFLLFSTLGLLAAALTIFFKPNEVLGLLHYKNVSEDRARWILRLEAAFFAITFCINTVIAILGICVNCCDVVDHYEDLEKTNRSKSALGRTQTEAIKRAAKNEETKASKLAQKMKDKYGKWTQEYGTPAKV
ncbi:uncharacterized protein [Physcomitrium patens]|uniref:Uncharacterized protein n=1 Tax=Physcomitrium patens TaxID=3218 RepID=A0A7I4A4H4_PHYPA|nr:uncharacterized protein LOC112287347 isoform X2 [Physcomitrium patens]XP_024386032.1 uncharacterized protein LOC112287347 isoform X2 [Physcomitrium patens]XP_024386033.1 uncharacterized protein LOC112287347 isoform X2 [Physcomitrium patens]|eukprot:XP_024386031.1 uncharacterized protein LOC112287347 isoform X2 [Physcomitrella patens]